MSTGVPHNSTSAASADGTEVAFEPALGAASDDSVDLTALQQELNRKNLEVTKLESELSASLATKEAQVQDKRSIK